MGGAIGELFGTDYSRLKFDGRTRPWPAMAPLEAHEIERAVGR
jgi:hypothetical protein